MSKVVSLIKKMLINRRTIVVFSVLFQIAAVAFVAFFFSKYSVILSVTLSALAFIVVVYMINTRAKPGYKMSWSALILTWPIFGGLFYFILKIQASGGKLKKTLSKYDALQQKYLLPNSDICDEIKEQFPGATQCINYLNNTCDFPAYRENENVYMTPGEEFFPRFLEELSKAEKFIFMEFFILDEGYMLDTTLELLKQKAKEGVEVRIIYDDVGSLFTLPNGYEKTLAPFGIKCISFNHFRPVLTGIQNNRDHRKIVVIDGKCAFTGGVNLADEYINRVNRFGYWKDSAIMFKGPCVWSFTVMFLQTWNRSLDTNEDFAKFKFDNFTKGVNTPKGYVIPYGDSPLNEENICEHVYMQLINSAKKYVYIETPYLIIDDSMMSAIILCAKSGVDVRIITPAVPDKKLVYLTTKSYYQDLIKAGVRIYEYLPGFLHSKVVVSDDNVATVGSANFDYRSLYLHFEVGSLLIGTDSVKDVKNDFLATLAQCKEITVADTQKNIFIRIFQSFLRLLAPFF